MLSYIYYFVKLSGDFILKNKIPAKKPLKIYSKGFKSYLCPTDLIHLVSSRTLCSLQHTVHLHLSDLIHLVSSHLSCNFCCEIILFLFDTFTSFETNEACKSKISIYCFKVLSYRLFSIFSFYICLI